MSETTNNLAWKALGGVATIAATIVTRKALSLGWKAITGNNPPDSPENPDTGTGEALMWVLASGVGVAVARLFATRKAAEYWEKATGHLPPGMEHDNL